MVLLDQRPFEFCNLIALGKFTPTDFESANFLVSSLIVCIIKLKNLLSVR